MAELKKYRWDDMPVEDLSPGLGRRLITGDRVMLAHVYLATGTVVPKHRHDNEQITYILEGALEFTLGDEGDEEVHTVHAGEALVIPGDLPHSAVALEDTLDVDVFSPPRQDWLDGSDTYLRGP
jgi:quercetin dioxygenase-like cupin family protein